MSTLANRKMSTTTPESSRLASVAEGMQEGTHGLVLQQFAPLFTLLLTCVDSLMLPNSRAGVSPPPFY